MPSLAHLFDNAHMHVYEVHQVTTYLRELFESDPHLGDLWIHGEVSNVSRPASGHVYFTLKDAAGQLRSAFFQRRGAPSGATSRLIENGSAVVAHGRVGVYEQRGDLQFYVDFVQPEGVGALQAEFERLRARLDEEGLFDPSRKRALPRFPQRIGVVTSASGAVFKDICHVLARRWPVAEIVLAPTPVQGPEAIAGIIGGIEQLNARDIDVLIIGRGGGSIEELWAFNDELVARAIFRSVVPTVSAVGHETDTTIADFVADRRAPTPSAAAEIVAPDRRDVSIRLGVASGTMASVVAQRLGIDREGVAYSVRRIERGIPDINRERQRIDETARRAGIAAEQTHRALVSGVGGCVWRLRTLDPLATLDRGYAIVQKGSRVVSSITDAHDGDAVDVRVRDGSFGARVGDASPPKKRAPRRRVPDAQAPLFTMPESRA